MAGSRFRSLLVRGPDASSNMQMVDELESSGALRMPECIRAFRSVDRGHFWVEGAGEIAYQDTPLRQGRLHQSAPHIYARALEALMPLTPGMSFLNVGSGTGYFSTLVSELIGDHAVNDGVDVWPENISHAVDRCRRLGKQGLEFTLGNIYQVDVEQGMRYDRIYIGACANSRSKYLYGLLEVGGVLVGPFQSGHGQQLRRVVRTSETRFSVEVLNAVQFATLIEPPVTAVSEGRAAGNGITVLESEYLRMGLPGVPFTFALRERPWSLERNKAYPEEYQNVVAAVLQGVAASHGELCLPPEVWSKHILPACPRRWFEQAQPSSPTSQSAAFAMLALAGEAAKRALRLRSLSNCTTNDGGSAHVSRASSTRTSRASSVANDADPETGLTASAQSPLLEDSGRSVLFEAFSNGQAHAIGDGNDPDDLNGEERHQQGLFAALTDAGAGPAPAADAAGANLARASAGRATADNRQPALASPVRVFWRCAGRCFAVLRAARRGRQNQSSRDPVGAGLPQQQWPGLLTRGRQLLVQLLRLPTPLVARPQAPYSQAENMANEATSAE
eukprot:TRINITY_DN68616_c0_g1_i1.p1 TRINITY_DN68616_c0_g1~~TRINITY_DN68616_c0_g1_i1.p1  ORF type:complete len:561 (-),score=104.94 TRINITY_DN68616_c0_g1_i1:112-1794(-)